MGIVIRMIFREGKPKQRPPGRVSRPTIAGQRGLTLWRDNAELVFAAAYRLAPRLETGEAHETAAKTCPFPAKLAPQR